MKFLKRLFSLDPLKPIKDESTDLVSIDSREVERAPVHVYSKEHLEELKAIFPPKQWSKGKSIEELAYSAGQQSVIASIENRLKKEINKAIL